MILGIDEVGRGPWAGPLVVGAVILGDDFPDIGLTDSKQLTAKRRASLSPIILERALATGLGWVSAPELDRIGLSAAPKLATRRAVKPVLARLSAQSPKSAPIDIIIDGTVNFLSTTPLADRVTVLKKADALVKEVSAASIIAKVARDQYMIDLAENYPVYGFEKHVGYGTAAHRQALTEHGPCPEHRQSFRPIQEILRQFPDLAEECPKCTPRPLGSPRSALSATPLSHTAIGKTAELAVASHLQAQNHKIIAHNFKRKTYEIDLISTQNQQIFFTEVKYSQKLAREGTPLVRITAEKQAQMRFAAECFLQDHPEYRGFAPLLAVASVSGPDFQVQDWLILT